MGCNGGRLRGGDTAAETRVEGRARRGNSRHRGSLEAGKGGRGTGSQARAKFSAAAARRLHLTAGAGSEQGTLSTRVRLWKSPEVALLAGTEEEVTL